MSDLISRAALFNALANANEKAEIFGIINAVPSVDAATVVHAGWRGWNGEKIVGVDRDGCEIWKKWRSYTCTKCDMGSAVKSCYCPNCGAKMDKEGAV